MLASHRLRSMFDFEKAVVRGWDLMNTEGHNNLKWNFRVIDKVAGFGTAVETVFQLKDIGVFRGAKRRLKFTNPDTLTTRMNKSVRLDEHLVGMEESLHVDKMGGMGKLDGVKRECISFNVSTSGCGWHGARKTPPKEVPRKTLKKPGMGVEGNNAATPHGAGPKETHRAKVTPTKQLDSVYKGQGSRKFSKRYERITTPLLETPSRLRSSSGTPKTPRNSVASKASQRALTSSLGKNQSSIEKFIISSPRVRRESTASGLAREEKDVGAV